MKFKSTHTKQKVTENGRPRKADVPLQTVGFRCHPLLKDEMLEAIKILHEKKLRERELLNES